MTFGVGEVIQVCLAIKTIGEKVVANRKRCHTLISRVQAISDAVTPLFENEKFANDPKMKNNLKYLITCLNDIKDYCTEMTRKDRNLAIRVFKHGSDEEEFVKLNERLQQGQVLLILLGEFKCL